MSPEKSEQENRELRPKEKTTVLIVEDEVAAAEAVRFTLKELGYEPMEVVNTGEEALAKAGELKPDLVLMDIGLCGAMDGIEAGGRIQSDFEVPVIYLTACADEDILQRAKETGPYGYILKPFKERELQATLESALGRRRRETSDRKRMEAALEKEREHARRLLHTAEVMLLVLNPGGRIVLVNRKGCTTLGYEREEDLLGKDWFATFVPAASQEGVREVFRRLVAGEIEPHQYFENPVVTRTGEERIIAWHNVVLRDEPGRITGTLSSGEDVTEQKRTTEALEKSEKRFRELAEMLPEIVFEMDEEATLTFVNRRAFEISGYTREDLERGFNPLDFLAPEDREMAGRSLLKPLGEQETGTFEYTACRKDGTRFPIMVRSRPVYRDGEIIGLRGIVVDITDRKRTEEALEESEQKYRQLVEQLDDAIFSTDREGLITYVSPAIETILGYCPSELMGRSCTMIVDPEDLAHVNRSFEHITDGNLRPIEYRARAKSGEVRWVRAYSRPFFSEGEFAGIRGTLTDLTERKKAEEALLAEKQFSEAVVRSLPGNFYVMDENGKILWWNQNVETSMGYSAEEVSRTTPSDFFVKEDRDRVAQKIAEAFVTGALDLEGRLLTRDGRNPTYHYVGMKVDIFGQSLLVGLGLDISERIQAQEAKARLEAQLRQSQKMEAIGTLAGGIAHDFNNILTAVIGYAELALLDAPHDGPLRQNIKEVLQSGNRAKELVRQILAFSRQTDPERRPVWLDRIVKDSVRLIRASLPSSIEIQEDIRVNRPAVLADPTQVRQIVVNLCTNGRDAMEGKAGLLRIGLTEEILDAGFAARHPDLRPGTYLKLTVSDTGCGMDKTIRERIFEPFFTTKGPGEGTGMGLSMVHGIVRSLEGAIDVKSEPGRGTVFELYLPRLERASEREENTDVPGAVPTGQGRILFVDDEVSLVNLHKQMIARLGYEVVAMTNSLEALEAFRARPGAFDLVITDMTMPNMSGAELAQALFTIRPGIPVLVCTGFSESLTAEKARALGLRGVLMKPVAARELAVAIRTALQAGREQKPPSRTTVLIIDDEEPVRHMLRRMLEREGYRVLAASDGREGLRVHEKDPADLIITDIFMPGADGLETIGKLRERFPQMGLIAISGGARAFPGDFLDLAGTLGADRVFSKPLDREKLLEAVRDLTEAEETPAPVSAAI